FPCAIRKAQPNSAGATATANSAKPEASGSSISTRMNDGAVAATTANVPPIAATTARSIVASRAVATAARMVAVAPLGQLAIIQNELTRRSAKAARSPAQAAPTRSFETAKRVPRTGGGSRNKYGT